MTVDSAMDTLRSNNMGVCPETGKSSGELSPHFLVSGDEECLLASDGNVSVIGDKQKKKQWTRLPKCGWRHVDTAARRLPK